MAATFQLPNGDRVSLEGDSFLIGRDRLCDLALPDATTLQPQHAKVRRMAGRWLVESLGDWFVQVGDETPGRKGWLKPGQAIRLSESGPEIVFERTTPAISYPTPADTCETAPPTTPPVNPVESEAIQKSHVSEAERPATTPDSQAIHTRQRSSPSPSKLDDKSTSRGTTGGDRQEVSTSETSNAKLTQIAQTALAAVADKVRQVGQKAKDFAQSEQVQESVGKAKAKWHGLSGRGKLISVAVGLLVIWLVYRFLFGGGGPPYEDLVERAIKVIDRQEASLLKEHNVENIRDVPERALEAAVTEYQRQIDEIASKYKPLPITLDKSAQELISDIESFPPVTQSSFLGRSWEIPLKFTARSRIREMNSGLVCKAYDDEGLVCEEVNVWTETAGSPGDRIHAKLAPLGDDDLGKACKLWVFGGK